MPLYNRDLAEIHDEGFGAFAADAAPGLLRRLRRAGIHDGLVVDLGCGSGIWARTLTDAGYDVLGVDRSEAMLEIARGRAPRAEFVHASVLDFVPPVCAAVTAVGEVFCYAGSLAPLHGIAGAHLILFDVATPARARTAGRSFHDGDGWVLCNDVTADGSTLTRRITTFTRHGDTWRRADEDHALRLFEPTDVLAELRAAGYEGHRLRSYGRELRPSPGLAFFAATPR